MRWTTGEGGKPLFALSVEPTGIAIAPRRNAFRDACVRCVVQPAGRSLGLAYALVLARAMGCHAPADPTPSPGAGAHPAVDTPLSGSSAAPPVPRAVPEPACDPVGVTRACWVQTLEPGARRTAFTWRTGCNEEGCERRP